MAILRAEDVSNLRSKYVDDDCYLSGGGKSWHPASLCI
jgi:hypothetical protein